MSSTDPSAVPAPDGRSGITDVDGVLPRELLIEDCELRMLCARFEYVLIQGQNHISMLDPVSGSVSALPVGIAEELPYIGSGYPVWLAFGQVASTGEYKLVRIIEEDFMDGYGNDPLCEVFTFREGIRHWGKNDNPAAYPKRFVWWRKMGIPPAYLDPSCTNGVVVKGAAYFLSDRWQFEEPCINSYNIEPGCIPSFNLETEQWSVALQGPLSQILEESNGMLNNRDLADRLMLGELKDFLVTIYCNNHTSTTDLWFLMDFESCVWSRQHIIQVDTIPGDLVGVQPLFVLDEGGIILLVRTGSRDVLQIYNPGASNATHLLEMASSSYVGVGMYTGSLLC